MVEMDSSSQRDFDALLARLTSLKRALRDSALLVQNLQKIRHAAIKLKGIVGDGDNGPLPAFSDAWYELESALNQYDLEIKIFESQEKKTGGGGKNM